MSKLPEWVYSQRWSDKTHIGSLTQALTIAWAVLDKLEKQGTIPWKDSDAVHIEWWAKEAKDALRRISELG